MENSEGFKKDKDHILSTITLNEGVAKFNSRIRNSMKEWLIQEMGLAMSVELNDDKRIELQNSLACLYNTRGLFEDAEKLHNECWQSRRSSLGINDPDTLTSINDLANLYVK